MTFTKEMLMALVGVVVCGMVQAAATNGVRVAATIRPEGTGFGFDPMHFTYKPLNDDYEVTLNGAKAEVRASRESRRPFNRIWPGRQRPLDQTERASYLAFEGTGTVSVTVRPKGQFKGVVVRPLSAGVRPVVRDGTVAFTLATNGYYVCEVDGTARALQLFYERPRDFSERDRATRHYGPGMHVVGEVFLSDHDRIYVDRDAIVFGCFKGVGVRDVRIFGHGVIDGRAQERVFEGCYSKLQSSCVRLYDSSDVVIDGPILMDSPSWVCCFFNCEDVDVRHVKVVGQWRYNTDGIDVCNSRRVRISDSYVRSFDDTISIKGVPPYRDQAVEDVTVERCVLWCQWGKTLEPGVETYASAFRRLVFRDCDLIHNDVAAINVSAGGSTVVEDVLFENLRVELQSDTLPGVLQENDGSTYPSDPGRKTPMLVKFDNGHWANPCDAECPRLAGMRNVRVRNLRVFADEGVGKPLIKVWSSGPQAGLRPFGPYEGIVFDGIFVNGRPVGKSDLALEVNMPIEMVESPARLD